MSLDFSKLENMKHQNGVTTARCPACAEEGRDRKGNHLFINNDGRFSCVCSPGKDGHSHRSRIFELVGVKEHSGPINIKIKEVKRAKAPEVIESNILGRLGRVKSSQDKIGNLKEVKVAAKEAIVVTKSEADFGIGVPSVPDSCSYTLEELRLIQSEDEDSLRVIHYAKRIFGGTIIPFESINIGKQIDSSHQNIRQSAGTKTDKAK